MTGFIDDGRDCKNLTNIYRGEINNMKNLIKQLTLEIAKEESKAGMKSELKETMEFLEKIEDKPKLKYFSSWKNKENLK